MTTDIHNLHPKTLPPPTGMSTLKSLVKFKFLLYEASFGSVQNESFIIKKKVEKSKQLIVKIKFEQRFFRALLLGERQIPKHDAYRKARRSVAHDGKAEERYSN